MAWSGYEAGGALVPRTIDASMSQTMALETSLIVSGVRTREGGVSEFSVEGASSLYFVHEFGTLDGHKFIGWERGGGCRRGLVFVWSDDGRGGANEVRVGVVLI